MKIYTYFKSGLLIFNLYLLNFAALSAQSTNKLANLVCGNSTINPNPIVTGQNGSLSYSISNTGNTSYIGGLTLWWRNSTSGTPLGTKVQTLSAGQSTTLTHNTQISSPPGIYKLQIEKDNGQVVCTRDVTVVSASPNLVCGSYSVNPSQPIQGQNATFSYTISNNGTGNYTGDLKMMWRNGNQGFPLGTIKNGLSAGATHTFTHSATPLTSTPGTWQLSIEDSNNTVICSKQITVTSAPTCVQGSGNPPTVGSPEWNATQYLCQNGIIQPIQNWTTNFNEGILRQDIAKIVYNGLYMGVPENQRISPAKDFPVPFTDMQILTGNEYWFTPAKVLAYLQYSDDRTPLDRDFINFRPGDRIERRYAVKMMLEAFNIPPSSSTQTPFFDFDSTDEMFKWVKKAHELGIITGTPCGSNTCFNPTSDITRQDAFILLHRILTSNNITKPTTQSLNSESNYFVPGNFQVATLNKVPGLDQANFNHYQKTSFSIAGRGLPLDFTHTYNSFLTELPKGYFEAESSGQSFSPLGIGWTHNYNIYAVKVDGYTIGNTTEPTKIMFYYPDGSINVFNYNTNQPVDQSVGIYDTMTKSAISGGERITITTKDQTKYTFENANNGNFYFAKSIKDRNNNGIRINWSLFATNKYRITSVQEEFNNGSTGRSLTFNYASNILPYLSSVTDNSINRTIQFSVNLPTRSLTSYTDPKGQQTKYFYDDANNYNKSNLLVEIQLPKGNKIRNEYVNRKLAASKTLNQSNVATSTTTVNWTPSYTSSGISSTATIKDPNNKITTFQHNALGNPISIQAPTGTTTVNNYASGNNANLPNSVTVNGQTATFNYDSKGNVLSVTKNGINNTFTYTGYNDVATHKDGRGNTITYNYDGSGNLTSVQRPSGGGTTTIQRNSFGQISSITNPAGIVTNFGYNSNGLQNQVAMPMGISTSSTYDNASRLLSVTDANGKTTSFQYDLNDNLTKTLDANGKEVTHTYDANDNHLSIKNPKNETQTMSYNFTDDLLLAESFGPHTNSYTYNADGTLASHTRGNGTFNFTYDSSTGRLLNDGHTQYTYDNRGNVTSIKNTNGTITMSYDINDRLSSYSDYYNNTVSYEYDNNNNVTRIIYPGNKSVDYTYDANNRCTTVTDWNGKVTSYTYLSDDRISKITLPNGTSAEYTYDAAGRMTEIKNRKSDGTLISSYGFTLDKNGNHTSESILEPSINAGVQNIANETVNYGQYPFNRIQNQGSTSYTHNTAGGITQAGASAYTYDVNDNLLTAPNSSFSYDGAGNRRAKTVNGTTTRYVLNILGMSQVLMETNAANAAQNYYVYGPTGLLYRVKPDNTTYSYYHYDYRGSTTAISNNAQAVTHSYSYDPFGKVLAKTETDANPYQYVGQHGVQYESPTLTFMRARYYDPTIGRFISEDPIWAMNLYPYADNNPIFKIDPRGENAVAETLDHIAKNKEVYSTAIGMSNAAFEIASVIFKTNKALAILKTQIELNALKSSITAGTNVMGAKAGAVSVGFLPILGAISGSVFVVMVEYNYLKDPDKVLKDLKKKFGEEKGKKIWSVWYGIKLK